jgi:HK97 family phage major capsid protein/HK97 family phage prohead protease
MAKIKVPAQLFRSAQFDRASVDTENRTVSLSVSSDEPYERYFGTEILSHKSDSVRLGRLKSAGALLFNHDRDAHIGRVLSASVDGSKLNVVVKFSKSALGQEKFQDVQDGILGEASIGYEIHKMEEDADEKSFTATDWEPYECSMVTVPADFSVGVGRAMEREKEIEIPDHVDKKRIADANANTKTTTMSEPTVTPEPAKIDVVKEREQAVTEFQSRCQKIDEYVGAIKQPKWQEAAREVASKHKNGKADFDAFRTEAINAFDPAKHVEVPETKIGMDKKERKAFSVRKLIFEAFSKGQLTGLEKEACEAAREQLRKAGDTTISDREGFTLPEDMANTNLAEDHDMGQRALDRVMDEVRQLKRGLSASTQNAGGYLVGVDLMTGSIIGLLRNKTLVSSMGIVNLDGLVNNVAIPRVTGGGTVYWLPEAGSVTASQQAFGQLTLSPHRLGADTFYTKQLLNQASLSVEAFVRDDLVRQSAVELDRVYLNGSGLFGEPQGIINTPGIGSITFSAAVTWAKLLTIESDIATANADLGAEAILTTPAARAKLKATVAFANTASPLWAADNTVNGYPAMVTMNVPSNKFIQGVWSEFIAARWAGLDVVVDPYSLKKSEQIEVTMHQYVDCGIRHPLAFEVSTDSAAQ